MREPGEILWSAFYESKCPVDVVNELEMPSEQQMFGHGLFARSFGPVGTQTQLTCASSAGSLQSSFLRVEKFICELEVISTVELMVNP